MDLVSKEIEGGQMTLFSTSRFGGVNKATDMMLKIGELSDVTLEQVKQSKESYQKALVAIDPYKRMLDVYTSRWFGNEPHNEGKGKKAKNVDMALAFLKSDESEKWFKNPYDLDGITPEYAKVAVAAMAAAQNPGWRFFHWELEFPEVWYAMGNRRENPGFDAVVGNPPYGYRTFLDISDYLMKSMAVGESENIAEYFIEQSLQIVHPKGYFGMILPKQLTYVVTWGEIRQRIVDRFDLDVLIDATEAFENVLLEQVIIIARPLNLKKRDVATGVIHNNKVIKLDKISHSKISKRIWQLYSYDFYDKLLSKIDCISRNLVDVCDIYHGLKNIRPRMNYKDGENILRGDNVGRFFCNDDIMLLPAEYITDSDRVRHCIEKIIVQQIVAHVTDPYPHIILMATMDYSKAVVFETINSVVLKQPDYNHEFILSILNSKWNSWFVHRFVFNLAVRTMMYRMGYLDYTPIRQIHFSTKQPERNRLFTALKTRYAIGPDEVTLNMVEDLLPKDLNGNFLAFQDGADWTYDPRTKMGKGICPEKSDVVHDFLSFLAEQMIVLNTQKQAEQKRFLGWLESKLSITEKEK